MPATNIMEFIDQSHQQATVEDLVSLFIDSIAVFGYTKFCSFTTDGLRAESHHVMADGPHYSREFFDVYEQRNFIDHDPVYRLFSHRRRPFSWAEVSVLALTRKQREVMETREQFGMKSGVGTAVQSCDRALVGMSLASPHADARYDQQALGELFALCNQFQLRRSSILWEEELRLPNVELSAREKEMLIWCSQGKSNRVIATILGISEKTVEFHLASSFRKLDVSSRTCAVLKAVGLKLINP